MSTLLRATKTPPVSILGRTVPIQLARWFVRLWISVVIIGSLLPGKYKEKISPNQPGRAHAQQHGGNNHRIIHLFAFGSSFFLLSFLAADRREQLQAAAEVMALGCIIEVLQDFLYLHGKLFEWWDLRDDAIGIAIALVIVQLMHHFDGWN